MLGEKNIYISNERTEKVEFIFQLINEDVKFKSVQIKSQTLEDSGCNHSTVGGRGEKQNY